MGREKQCVKCGEIKPVTEFNFKSKKRGKRNGRCRICTRKDIMAAYYKNRDHYLRYRRKRNEVLRDIIRKYLWRYLEKNPCVDCGINDPRVLQFDHVRGKKKTEVSNYLRRNASLGQVKEEVRKCDVRCANCHSIKTAIERNYYSYIQ